MPTTGQAPAVLATGHLTRGETLLLAASLGEGAGIVELGVRHAGKLLEGRYLWAGTDLTWMLPLADTLPVLAVGLALAGLTLLRPIGRRHVLAVLLGVATMTAGYVVVPRIHWLALAALSVGVAVVGSSVMDRHFAAARRLVLRMAAGAAVLILLATVVIRVTDAIAERRAIARIPAGPAGASNVLLLVIDTQRSLAISRFGHTRSTTPELDRLAPAATVFDFAVSTAPWTLPSHASLFTGRLPHESVTGWFSPMDRRWPTLAGVLASRGWLGAGFSANREFVTREFGLQRGFTTFDDFPRQGAMVLDAGALVRALTMRTRAALHNDDRLARRSAAEINARFLAWQQRHPGRPFFGFLNYYEPHEPYIPHEPFRSRFAVPPRQIGRARLVLRDAPPDSVPDEMARAEALAYEATIAESDAAVGALFDSLDRRGLLDNTLVIVTADHGEEFGEHGVYFHGHSLYLPVLRVPLMVHFPGRVPSGVRVAHPVSLRDIPATVLDLLGQADAAMPGASLARWWDTDASRRAVSDTIISEVDKLSGEPPWIPAMKGDMRSALTARHHYIVNGDGRPELYDVMADPLERHDLSADTTLRFVMQALHDRLVAEGALPARP